MADNITPNNTVNIADQQLVLGRCRSVLANPEINELEEPQESQEAPQEEPRESQEEPREEPQEEDDMEQLVQAFNMLLKQMVQAWKHVTDNHTQERREESKGTFQLLQSQGETACKLVYKVLDSYTEQRRQELEVLDKILLSFWTLFFICIAVCVAIFLVLRHYLSTN